MSESRTRSALDALMHEWHEWSSRGGREPNERYDGCYCMADFVIKHLNEWLTATEMDWCSTHKERWWENSYGMCTFALGFGGSEACVRSTVLIVEEQ